MSRERSSGTRGKIPLLAAVAATNWLLRRSSVDDLKP
jgi:hypothetical protein